MEFDIVLAGPVASDLVVAEGVETRLTGGGAWYGAFPLLTLGLRVGILARVARRDDHLLEPLRRGGARVMRVEAFETSGIRNDYGDESMETRTCTVLGCASALLPEDIPALSTRLFYVSPLMRGEIPVETLRHLAASAPCSVDLQGYIRYRSGDRLPGGPFEPLPELLSLARYVKADEAEARLAVGTGDPSVAGPRLLAFGPREALITGPGRATVVCGEGLFEEPIEPGTGAGRTGRGDTCMATYVGARLTGRPVAEALRLAARVTTRKMEVPGPYLGPVDE